MSGSKDAARAGAKTSETEDAAEAAATGDEVSAEAPEAEREAETAEDSGGAPADLPEQGAAEAEAAEQPPAEAAEPDPLAAAEAEIAELKDKLLRAMAEVENVRRRGAREREEASKYALTSFARELLSVADNLRRALASVPEEARDSDDTLRSLLDGVELTERELLAVFERHDIRPIEALGEKFDHNWHQAVVQLERPDKPAGTVVEVIQAGYAIADRLLRPAMVAVAKGAPEPGGEEEEGETSEPPA